MRVDPFIDITSAKHAAELAKDLHSALLFQETFDADMCGKEVALLYCKGLELLKLASYEFELCHIAHLKERINERPQSN
jgi:hypothetical protein